MSRFSKLVLSGGTILAVAVVGAGVAHAGSTAPPATQGAAVYSGPSTTTVCSSGRPTGLTFRFAYSGANLHKSYKVRASIVTTSPDYSLDRVSPSVAYTIVAHSSGTFQHTFALPAAAKLGYQVYASASVAVGPSSQYTYVAHGVTLTCPGTTSRRLVAPTVRLSPVGCAGNSTITFDATKANISWYWIAFAATGGFEPGPNAIPAGKVVRFRQTHVKPGDVIEIHFDAPQGLIDIGKFKFVNGC